MPTVNVEVFLNKKIPIMEVYAIVGAERFLQIEALKKIKETLAEKNSDIDYASFTSPKIDISRILDEVRAGSLFSNRRIITLDVPTKYFDTKAVKDVLSKYVEKPSKTSVLILISPAIKKNSILHKTIVKHAIRIDCEPLKPFKLAGFIQRRAENMNIKFGSGALDFLIECVGASVGSAVSELEKLSIYLGDEKVIRIEDIENVLGYKGIGNVWNLIDSMFAGNMQVVVREVYTLMDIGEEPMQLINLMISQIKNLWLAVASFQEGYDADGALENAGIPKFKWRDYRRYVSTFDLELCKRLHKKLIEAELKLKFSPVPNKFVFEFLILGLTREIQQFKQKQKSKKTSKIKR